MKFSGSIHKMSTQEQAPIQYYLQLGADLLHTNQLIGKTISLQHIGYCCKNCGKDEKIFRMGFCKKCFFESPYASESIIRPELSKAHLGQEERDLDIEKQIQLVPHIVYLSYTGDVKVGVTRESQIPTRWIDQGATSALPIARTENRYQAGMIEVALKQHLSDKTNWRKMLKDMGETDQDLQKARESIKNLIPEEYQKFYLENQPTKTLEYPYEAPEKIASFTLDKKPNFQGILKGMKGQYLLFEDQSLINLRAHEGYVVEMEVL